MEDHQDLVHVAAMIAEPARARMLLGLMSGRALTATELSLEADVAPSTASSHLARLTDSGLVTVRRQGRHRYFTLASPQVAEIVEHLMVGALPSRRVQTGPRDPALRHARVCYDHLAGFLGVGMLEGLVKSGHLLARDGVLAITGPGADFFHGLGIDVDGLRSLRRTLCRPCLDWSVRREHLAGSLAAALLDLILANGWARRDLTTRVVRFEAAGERAFRRAFGVEATADD